MHLAREQFIAGVQADYIRDRLLQSCPEPLDDTRKATKQLQAARTTRKQAISDDVILVIKFVVLVGRNSNCIYKLEETVPWDESVACK